jgi:hypothetical protein
MHRSNPPRTLQATSPDVPLARVGLPVAPAAAITLVLVLITVQPGAGIGFA